MLDWLLRKRAIALYVQLWSKRFSISVIGSSAYFEDESVLAIATEGTKKRAKIVAVGRSAVQYLSKANINLVYPFLHQRQLVKDFAAAEKVLRYGVNQIREIHHFRISPNMIIHPMEKTEGGLSDIEVRVFRELALCAGAQTIKVYDGPPLHARTADFDSVSTL